MFRNYFTTAFRHLAKNKLYAAINIFGLTAGLTACLLIGVYISQELSYDQFNVKKNRIVRVTMEYAKTGTVNQTATTGTKVGPQFKRIFPAVEEYVRTYISSSVVKSGSKLFDEPHILFADPSFFQIFSFPLLEGDPATVLNSDDKIVITRSMAKKYFGNEEAINKTLTAIGKDLTVSGICEDAPQNSQIKFDFVTRFMNLGNGVKDETWWTANWITYFLVRDEKNIPQLQQQVDAYMKTAAVKADAGLGENGFLTYHLEPLTRVHLYSSLAGFEPNGSIRYIYMFALIALLILIIACANYTNLATALSAGRGAEIGMRKVMGASKRQLFLQFIGESFIITIMAAGLAMIASILLIPYFNIITGKHFTPQVLLQPVSMIGLILFSLLVSFFAGWYPALILSGAQIMGVLKKGFSFTGGNSLVRKILVVAQFGISVFLIIYTVLILQQMNFMHTKNVGYDKDHIVVLPIGGKMLQNFQNIKNAIAQVPAVEGVTAAYETPEYVEWSDGMTATDEKGQHDISLNAMPVDLDFIRTMGMQLVAGRDFQQSDLMAGDSGENKPNQNQFYIINETLAKKIGWTPEQAVGRMIENRTKGPVVGVVKDFNFSSLHDPIGPLLIFLGRDFSRTFMVRINGNNMRETLRRMETVWKQYVPDRPFNYHFLDDDYNKLYLAEQRTASLFSFAAGLAIVLASLGLFGLAAFTTVQRTKEIGIRRVLGATIQSITMLVAKNFLQLVCISIIIAVPLAWWAGNQWLQDFAFRINIGWGVFAVAALTAIAVALVTVSFHTIKASVANPVKNLRTE